MFCTFDGHAMEELKPQVHRCKRCERVQILSKAMSQGNGAVPAMLLFNNSLEAAGMMPEVFQTTLFGDSSQLGRREP